MRKFSDQTALLYIGVILLMTMLAGCRNGRSGDNVVASDLPENGIVQAIEVDTTTAQIVTMHQFMDLQGVVVSARDIVLRSGYAGVVKRLVVKNGARVQKNEEVARFEDSKVRLEKARAELALRKAEVEFQSRSLGFARVLKQGGPEADSLRQILMIDSGLDAARIDLAEAESQLEAIILKAPFSGTVTNVNVIQGEHIDIGKAICSLYDDQNLLVRTNVLETDINMLRIDHPAEISTIGASGKKPKKARIEEINPRVDDGGMVSVYVRLLDHEAMFPGMHVTVRLKVPIQDTLTIPKSSVVIRSGRSVVFIYENGLAKWKYVTTGNDNGEEVEIVDGLEAGDWVITSNNLQLAHDAPVAVASENPR